MKVELLREVDTCPESKSSFTVEVWHDGEQGYSRVAIGPGVGPHVTTSPATLDRWSGLLDAAAQTLAEIQAELAPEQDASA